MGHQMHLKQDILNEHHRFTWKIHNFVSTKTLGREVRTSLKMGSHVGLPYDCDWTCYLIRSSKSPYLDTFQIELSKKPSSLKGISASFQIQIKRFKQDDILYYDSKVGPFVNMVEENWECKLIGPNFIEYLPLDEEGTLEVDILVTLKAPKNKTIYEILRKFEAKFIENLQFDLANMLSILSLPCPVSNTVIVSKVDGKEFPVHREMLAARSNLFLRMFESKMKENSFERIVEVADVSSEVLKIILHFLYTGIVLDEWNIVSLEELVFAAAKYELHDLIEFLDAVVGQMCTLENAGKLMNLARKHNLKRAKIDLFNFIKTRATNFEQYEKFMEDANSNTILEPSSKPIQQFQLWG